MTDSVCRVAIVTQGFGIGGGIPTSVRWVRDQLVRREAYRVDVHDLATSSRDANSRRLSRPATWRSSLIGPNDPVTGARTWGANFVEFEPMRYRRRHELTAALADYDLIHVVAGGPALGASVLECGPPVVVHFASPVLMERGTRNPQWSRARRVWSVGMTRIVSGIERSTVRRADCVLVMNDRMVQFVRAAGQTNVRTIQIGVDTDAFRPDPRGWYPDGYLLSVCRLAEPRKRLDRLVATYADLVARRPSIPDLVLAGRGQLPLSLVSAISDAGLAGRIDVRSDVAPEDLPALYRGASVYLQASDEEGFGISTLEAMACGVPVVATVTAGSQEVAIDGDTGYLVPLMPAADVLSGLATGVENVLDGKGHDMARSSRERAERVFADTVRFAAMERCYVDLLGR